MRVYSQFIRIFRKSLEHSIHFQQYTQTCLQFQLSQQTNQTWLPDLYKIYVIYKESRGFHYFNDINWQTGQNIKDFTVKCEVFAFRRVIICVDLFLLNKLLYCDRQTLYP